MKRSTRNLTFFKTFLNGSSLLFVVPTLQQKDLGRTISEKEAVKLEPFFSNNVNLYCGRSVIFLIVKGALGRLGTPVLDRRKTPPHSHLHCHQSSRRSWGPDRNCVSRIRSVSKLPFQLLLISMVRTSNLNVQKQKHTLQPYILTSGIHLCPNTHLSPHHTSLFTSW